LQFLWNLTEFLGFYPGLVSEFLEQLRGAGVPGLAAIDAEALSALFHAAYGQEVVMKRGQRQAVLAALIYFYQLHMESFGDLRSLQILQEVLA
jgi:DNA repair protein RecO (recombination protein O)